MCLYQDSLMTLLMGLQGFLLRANRGMIATDRAGLTFELGISWLAGWHMLRLSAPGYICLPLRTGCCTMAVFEFVRGFLREIHVAWPSWETSIGPCRGLWLGSIPLCYGVVYPPFMASHSWWLWCSKHLESLDTPTVHGCACTLPLDQRFGVGIPSSPVPLPPIFLR